MTRHWLELVNQWLEVTRPFLWLDVDSTESWLDSDSTKFQMILTRLWLEGLVTLTRLEGLVTLTRQKWFGYIIDLWQCLFWHQKQKSSFESSVHLAIRSKNVWWNNLSKGFAPDGKIDTTSLKCECSCLLCPNAEMFAQITAIFHCWGCNRIPGITMPYACHLCGVRVSCVSTTSVGLYLQRREVPPA